MIETISMKRFINECDFIHSTNQSFDRIFNCFSMLRQNVFVLNKPRFTTLSLSQLGINGPISHIL